MNSKFFNIKKLLGFLLLILFAVSALANKGSEGTSGSKKLSKTNAYVNFQSLDINNILIYFENSGNIQDPSGNWSIEFPKGSGKHPIFAAGFALSGYIDGDLSTAWMASASRIEEWQPGPIINGHPDDPNNNRYRVYKYTKGDSPAANGDIAQWPVDLGAEYEDLNNNGVYDPANGDKPRLLGDQMVWYVINDGIAPSARLSGSKPMGIEAQVTAFAFQQSNDLGNVAYVIYKFINKGSKTVENAIFSVWSDPDLGDAEDDLVGVDSSRSLAYCWNEGNNDKTYGAAPPSSGYDFFLGPKVFTGNPSDTVKILGKPYVGYKQLVMDSFVKYVRGRVDLPDPGTIDEARYYQEGLRYDGRPFEPLTEGIGGTANDNPRIVHPGYPEFASGWRDSKGQDRRMMINTKPFTLAEGDTQVIVVGYMVGQGSDNAQSVAKLRVVDDFAQKVFNANFKVAGPPPAPKVVASRIDNEGNINLTFWTPDSYNDVQTDDLGNKKVFKGYKIYQYRTGEFSDVVDGVANKKLLLQVDKSDGYDLIYQTNPDGITASQVYQSKTKFVNDSDYSSPDGFFNFTLTRDAFTTNRFIEGETYYFGISSFNVEVNKIIAIRDSKDPTKILGWKHPEEPINESGEFKGAVIYKNSLWTPYYIAADDSSMFVKKDAGNGSGLVYVDVLNPTVVKDNEVYKLDFYYLSKDSLVWRVKNSSGKTLLDKRSYFSSGMTNPVVDGLSIRVGQPVHKVKESVFNDPSNPGTASWVSQKAYRTLTGAAVLTESAVAQNGGFIKPIEGSSPVEYTKVTSKLKSNLVRDIQIEFTKQNPSLAYRYLAGVSQVAQNFTPPAYQPKSLVKGAADSAVWAGFTKGTTDAPNTGRLKATRKPGVGIVSLPFRVWDKTGGTPRQLKIGILESFALGTQADFVNGKWDGKADAKEVLLISYDDYDANLAMPADSNHLDTYMTYLFRNNSVTGNFMIAWEGIGDTTAFVEGSTLTLKTTAFGPEDKYTLSGFTSEATYYEENKKSSFEKLTIYPNPYMGDNYQEVSSNERFVSLLNVPRKATIRVYNLAGELVRKLEKDDASSLFRWDLKNSTGLFVASGVYLIHIDAPGVGSKVLKFALVQRQEQIGIY